jgi:GH15 family glucan-1,4-alpha-glucosidase
LIPRGALTLKALSFGSTGAVMAGATTSLPETLGGVRNWDYRYTWIRETVGTLSALKTVGLDGEANDCFNFVADAADVAGGDLQLMYGVGGETTLSEATLDHLSGYQGARLVCVGNAAYSQRQHDMWGAVVAAIDAVEHRR